MSFIKIFNKHVKPCLEGEKTTHSLAIKKHANPGNSSARFSAQISMHTEKMCKPVRNEQNKKTDINLVRLLFQRVTRIGRKRGILVRPGLRGNKTIRKVCVKKNANPGDSSSGIPAQLLVVHGEKVYLTIIHGQRKRISKSREMDSLRREKEAKNDLTHRFAPPSWRSPQRG